MALLSKKNAPFAVPTMAETDADYAQRVERYRALNDAIIDLRRQEKSLERELEGMPAPKVSAEVAALLGDAEVDARTAKAKELADVRRSIADHATAIALQTTRVDQAKASASRAVCEAVRPEFRRRVAELAKTVEAAIAARADFMALVADLEADDVAWRYLGDPVPHFMGDPRDGQAVRWLAEMKGSGYVD